LRKLTEILAEDERANSVESEDTQSDEVKSAYEQYTTQTLEESSDTDLQANRQWAVVSSNDETNHPEERDIAAKAIKEIDREIENRKQCNKYTT